MFKVKIAKTNSELEILGKMKLKLMEDQKVYASRFNISDYELEHYSLNQALSTASKRDNYLLYLDDTTVGMSQVEEQVSDIDYSPIIFVHSLYIEPLARGKGIPQKYLNFICDKYNKRIECECWYNNPANMLFQRYGFENLMTRYMLNVKEKH